MKPLRLKVTIPVEIDPAQLLDGLKPMVRQSVLKRELAKLLRAHFSKLDWLAPGDEHATPSYEEIQGWLIEGDLARPDDE